MPKNIVFPYVMFTKFIDEPSLKRLALFFDNIYIDKGRLNQILSLDQSQLKSEFRSLEQEKLVWEKLIEKGVVITYPYSNEKFKNAESSEEGRHLIEIYKGTMPPKQSNNSIDLTEQEKTAALDRFFLSHDISIRLDVLTLKKQIDAELYPFLRTHQSFQMLEKKSNVVQFLLNNIPQPALDTSWEHILEYRTDEEIKNKYLALINWINRVSSSPSNLSDIQDEYEYLYSEYLKHFKLHQMKYNSSMIEVLVTAGVGLLIALQSGQFISSFKNLLQMNLSHIKLLEEEAKLPGREVAYIYHTRKKFGEP